MSNSRIRLIASGVLITFIVSSGSMAQVLHRSVCGTVIFRAEAEAAAYTEVLLDLSYEGVKPGAVVDRDGNFCIDNFVGDLNKTAPARLYVTSFCNPNDLVLVDAPFWMNLRKIPRFAGKGIEIGPGSRPYIGEAEVQVAYGHVSLRVLDRRDRPLLTNAEDWRPIWLRVRAQNGVRVYESGLSIAQIERSVDLNESRINLALPQGTWSLEVSLSWPPDTVPEDSSVGWLKVRRKLKVGSCGETLDITLRAPRTTGS